MIRYILIVFAFVLLTGCGVSTKSAASKRSLMLLDQAELPRNAKFVSPKYQQKLRKSMKKHHRTNKRRYRRAGR